MENTQTKSSLSRRDFLRLLAATGTVVAGGHLLNTYAPWIDYDERTSDTRRSLDKELPISAQMHELIRYATLAASGHNTQPWKFSITDDRIKIYPDYARRVPVIDPSDRELWISLGCALENLLVAARAIGYTPEVTYPNGSDLIQVRLHTDTSQNSPLFDAIPLRQTTRSEYDGQPVKPDTLDQIRSLNLEPGINLNLVLDPTGLETILEYVNQGNLNQIANRDLVDELIEWMRFNKKEAFASLDGLFTRCSGNPEVPGWLGRIFLTSMKPEQQADTDTKKLRSSSGVIVISSTSDGKEAWVRTGQVHERLNLTMTALGIKSSPLNQPIEEISLRPQFQNAMGLGKSSPQMLIRFGHAEAMPRSLRRPVEQVLVI